ncbi:unnamed protein product [Ilex paraguariensis]|uniref:Cytochrome b6-f complex subunit 7 n=1 Tax=Ilex paraguariensis TaxID=185542 RepID=A0ABC8UEB0_9AQUA
MATASASLSPATSSLTRFSSKTQKRMDEVVIKIGGMNSFAGLKAHNSVASIGLPVCTEQCFAEVLNSLKTPSHAVRRGGGGALSSTCDDAAEIFKIAAIMNGLVLIGVAVGFVLLRIEAAVEESEK